MRNKNIIIKLLKLIKYNFYKPFNIHIRNNLEKRKYYNIYIIYLNKLCNKYNINNDIKDYLVEYIRKN